MKTIENKYSKFELDKLLEKASTVNETDAIWVLYFDKDCKINFNSYVSQSITAKTTIVIGKHKYNGFMGSFYKAAVFEK